MAQRFRNALVELSLPVVDGLPDTAAADARVAARTFTSGAIACAPQHLRIGVTILTIGLWLWCLPVGGLPPRAEGRRWQWAQAFTCLPGPTAMLFRLYAGLSAFAFFDHPAVAAHLRALPTSVRQARFRELRHSHNDD